MLHKLKLCYHLLKSKHFFVFLCPNATTYYQSSDKLLITQAYTILDNLEEAIELTETEEMLLHQARNIINRN